MELRKYYTVKEIATIAKKSVRTVERKRDALIREDSLLPKEKRKYRGWFRLRSKPYKYSYEFLSELVSDEVYRNFTTIRQLRNTIDCLTSDRHFERNLSSLDWDYFITITYKYPLSNDVCSSIMRHLADTIDLHCFDGHYRMFFTSEPFTSIKGYHNHLVLKLDDAKAEDITDLIVRECPKGRVDVQHYDKYLAGVFYAAKKELQGEDWDIYGNNLAKDGIDVMNRSSIGRVA